MQQRNAVVVALSAGLLTASAVFAAPAQAEPVDDAFLAALTESGVGAADPASAAATRSGPRPSISPWALTRIAVQTVGLVRR